MNNLFYFHKTPNIKYTTGRLTEPVSSLLVQRSKIKANKCVIYITYEKIIFNKVREYALATYNYGNLKSIVKEHNIDVFFKYKRYLA